MQLFLDQILSSESQLNKMHKRFFSVRSRSRARANWGQERLKKIKPIFLSRVGIFSLFLKKEPVRSIPFLKLSFLPHQLKSSWTLRKPVKIANRVLETRNAEKNSSSSLTRFLPKMHFQVVTIFLGGSDFEFDQTFQNFFCSTSCHLLVLDGFHQHYEATVHCSKQRCWLTSATSKKKLRETLGFEPGSAGWEART